ncbi:TPA: hypothetical protein L6A34_31270 [Pseudomonas aeruginosa]|jgi:hypothetical protein|uniref:Lar family restriction alleviation protein n=1 Tax=Pseudomonas aeruginosa TaxID=287 RepID=UPI00071B49BD|nr:Lar family restriction alleviation protein [Pseudomonas aeruginosa]ELQ8317554.1 hypothetical protein [Pseudomonas aeruginosa]KSM65093.1 hypothetical protein APA70_22120 [Pseudomonas aeruginosa]HBP5961567.1 hypothetical protein [Pseudomonas aeruginosa]HBP6298928.1 hypothetical protein [Pseudomonas aeruginosa]HBP6386402.1 hypothetical protein [Pseudomonas aeruginosa]
MTDLRYRVTLTAEQLQALSLASETCSRLVMGQMDMALNWLRDRDGKIVSCYELTKAVEALTRPAQGLAPNQSGGVGWHESGDAMWDIYTHIRHRLAWDRAYSEGVISPGEPRKWPEMSGVNFDDPTNLVGPPIKIEQVDPEVEGHDDDCPFCGSSDSSCSTNGEGNFFVNCLGCGAEGPVASSLESAHQLWRRRKRGD